MATGCTPAVLGRRACAVLAAGSAGLHGLMLGHSGSAAMAVLMLAMMIGCLFCARDLWQRNTLGVWCAVALMNLAMVALHLPAPGHNHGMSHAAQPSTVMGAATMLALVEATVAGLVLYYRTRHRHELVVTGPVG